MNSKETGLYLAVVLAILVLVGACPSWANEKVVQRELSVRAERMDYDEQRKVVRLVGNVCISSGNVVMTASNAMFSTDTQIAQFQGHVKLTEPGSVLVGDRMKVWYKEHRASLIGNCRFVSDALLGQQSRTPAVISASSLDYDWLKGLGTAHGVVKMQQGQRRAFADKAVYRRLTDTVELVGNVRFEQGPDQWLTSDKVAVDLKQESVVAVGQVTGRFIVDSKEKVDSAISTTGSSAAAPTTRALEPELQLQLVEQVPILGLPGADDK